MEIKDRNGCYSRIVGISMIKQVECRKVIYIYIGVSKNRGTPKSSISIGFSIINHPFWGTTIFGNIHIYICVC